MDPALNITFPSTNKTFYFTLIPKMQLQTHLCRKAPELTPLNTGGPTKVHSETSTSRGDLETAHKAVAMAVLVVESAV